MPDPRDYTTGELTSAANLFKEAADLLSPTADELIHIADGFDLDQADDALHLTRTARHLTASALHLKVGELTIRRLTRDIGRTYQAIKSRLLGLTAIAAALSLIFHLAAYLPGMPGTVLSHIGGSFTAYSIGVATAGWILHHRTRPPPDP